MIVADSDVLIDALRGREPAKGRIVAELERGELATTSISVFELRSGARSRKEREKVEALLAPLSILPVDEPAAQLAAEARLELESQGQPIGTADSLIAGVCLARNAILLTRNRAHFERIPKLSLGRLEPNGR